VTTWLRNARKASFRGVPLPGVDGVSSEGNPRTAEHEYPGIAGGWVEHLERGLRTWSLTCTVTGTGYMTERDTLEAALDVPEPGLLVHPTRGDIMASVVAPYTVDERDGTATFRITFRESGRPAPVAPGKPSAGSALLSRVEATLSAVGGYFADAFSVDILPSWARAETIQAVTDQVTAIRDAITGPVGAVIANASDIVQATRDLEDEIATLIDTPDVLAARFEEVIRQVQHLGVYRLLSADAGLPDPATMGTPTEQTVADDIAYAARLQMRQVLACWGETVQGTTWASYDDAQREADYLIGRIGAELDFATDDEYQALVDLRVAVSAYLAAQAKRLPRLRTVVASSPVSCIELAWRYHADADRADEVRDRNDALDCGYVTGDVLLLGA
jgi:prophage DNA circulation protein